MSKNSRLSGFYKLQRGERLDALREFCNIPVDQTQVLTRDGSLSFDMADLFVENAVGSYPLPLGIATSFKINGKDYLIPMAVEESSVVAATSNAAKIVYESGGFKTDVLSQMMIGQIQLLDLPVARFSEVTERIHQHKHELLKVANEIHPRLLMRGGGARDLEVRTFAEAEIPFLVVHLLMDTKDAMGANLINTACERLAPLFEEITGARIGLKILSNLADRRIVKARCEIDCDRLVFKDPSLEFKGEDMAQRIYEAFIFADNDPYRATTHNKGIMNGVDPVVIATGNDWRAVEAGVHAYAARSGRYRSLSRWSVKDKSLLVGEVELPLQLGTVGGVTRLHPMARVALQILENPNAAELAQIIACSGLAANLAAMRALCTTGIQRGHMKLHAKNLALAAGADRSEIDIVAREMLQSKNISAGKAEELLKELRERKARAHEADCLTSSSPS
jgi:hydroxymethylglutaryl-CoA reductase